MDPGSSSKSVVVYVVSQELVKFASLLPSNKRRSAMVHSLVNALGLLSSASVSETRRIQVVHPTRATHKDLLMYHTNDFLDFVLDPKNSQESVSNREVNAEFGLEDDCPPFPGLPDYVQLVAGASLTAANALKLVDVAICWDGGRHHAQKSHASGYCYVADCILTILCLKRFTIPSHPSGSASSTSSRKPRIMYLDLDLHFSDAVSQAFYSPNPSNSSQILTFSIHHSAPGFFPHSPLSSLTDVASSTFDPFTLSLPLAGGASDKTYATIWPIVERVKDTFQPDYVVVQCGVDSLAGDPCAVFNWSLGSDEGSLGWCIGQIIDHWPGKKLLLGGGGYNSPNAARAWSYLTSVALGNALPLDTDIPDHTGFPLYGPSFTLDVPAGHMRDLNTEEYLRSVEVQFEKIVSALAEKVSTNKA